MRALKAIGAAYTLGLVVTVASLSPIWIGLTLMLALRALVGH